jgi:hypothetical protein
MASPDEHRRASPSRPPTLMAHSVALTWDAMGAGGIPFLDVETPNKAVSSAAAALAAAAAAAMGGSSLDSLTSLDLARLQHALDPQYQSPGRSACVACLSLSV